MNRDMGLILKILQWTKCKENQMPQVPSFCGHSEEQVHYHIGLCRQAGSIETTEPMKPTSTTQFTTYGIRSLTWAGHEMLKELEG